MSSAGARRVHRDMIGHEPQVASVGSVENIGGSLGRDSSGGSSLETNVNVNGAVLGEERNCGDLGEEG